MQSEEEQFLQKMRTYYKFLFPHRLLAQWLSYSSDPRSSDLHKRQFSYTILHESQEIYVRYQIVRDADDMHAQLTREGQIPVKLDIGSFFECEPIKGRTNHPIAKELVVDIDINDYDMVRTCCQGKQCCSRCWKFLAAALTLLRTSFEEDFDFHNFMCVFSGRRGVHMWVCDRRAIMLQVPQRRSVISYLMLTTGNEHAQSYLCENTLREVRVDDRKRKDELKKHLLQTKVPPMVARAIAYLKPLFQQIVLKDQQALEHEKCVALILRLVQNRSKALHDKVRARWQKKATWQSLLEEIDSYEKQGSVYKRITFLEEQIVLTFLYPRLDVEVSIQLHHLLKSPFSVHPSTKKVSVPIAFDSLWEFDPASSVGLDTLISELERLEDLKQNDVRTAKKTSLRESIQILEEHANRCSSQGLKATLDF